MNNGFYIEDFIFVLIVLVSIGLVLSGGFVLYIYFRDASKKGKASKRDKRIVHENMVLWESDNDDENDITNYPTEDIPKTGLFSASERRMEYRRRGKSPSGVIDGVYNDMNRENGRPYNDMDRDWDADA